jgi:NTE family protein
MAIDGGSTGNCPALVLGGGGAFGAVQAAYIAAAWDAGFRPAIVVGTSVGSLNGAWVAMHPGDPEGLLAIWQGLDRRKVLELKPLGLLLRLLKNPRGISANTIVHELVARHVLDAQFEDTQMPLAITATNLSRGCKEVFRTGSLANAIIASTAVPGVFHPVELDGELFVDGSLVAATDLATAVAMGATEILAIDLTSTMSPSRPKTALGVLRRSLEIVEQSATAAMEDCLRLRMPMHVVRPNLAKQSAWRLATSAAAMAAHLEMAQAGLAGVLDRAGHVLPIAQIPAARGAVMPS